MSDTMCAGCGAWESDEPTVGQDSCETCGGPLCDQCATLCEPKWCQGRSCTDPEIACVGCGWDEDNCTCDEYEAPDD